MPSRPKSVAFLPHPIPTPVTPARKYLWGPARVPGWELAYPILHCWPRLLGQWCRGNIRPETWSAATWLVVPYGCPRQSLEPETGKQWVSAPAVHQNLLSLPRGFDLISHRSGLGIRISTGPAGDSNLQQGCEPEVQSDWDMSPSCALACLLVWHAFLPVLGLLQ